MEKVSTLIRDPDLHPRQGKTDPMHMQRLSEAMQAGAQLPPVIVCKDTRKLVAGWHRCGAAERLYGVEGAVVEVEWRHYASDQERFEDALRESASSELPLSHFNQQACVLRAEQFGLSIERVATALAVPGESLQRRIITAHVERREGALTPLKAPFRHMAGHVLSTDQAKVNNNSDGRKVVWHCDQILRPLRAGMLNWDDATMVNSLTELRDALVEATALTRLGPGWVRIGWVW